MLTSVHFISPHENAVLHNLQRQMTHPQNDLKITLKKPTYRHIFYDESTKCFLHWCYVTLLHRSQQSLHRKLSQTRALITSTLQTQQNGSRFSTYSPMSSRCMADHKPRYRCFCNWPQDGRQCRSCIDLYIDIGKLLYCQ